MIGVATTEKQNNVRRCTFFEHLGVWFGHVKFGMLVRYASRYVK